MRRIPRCALWLACLSISFTFCGCRKAQSSLTQFKLEVGKWFDDSVGRVLYAKDPVLAEVGSSKIRMSDLQSAMDALPPNQPVGYASAAKRLEVLNRLVFRKVWVVMAEKAGAEKDPAFSGTLSLAREYTLAELYRTRYSSNNLSVSDADIQTYYKTHPAQFGPGIELRYRRIEVKTLSDARLAQNLLKTMSFEQVAQQVSVSLPPLRGRQITDFVHGPENHFQRTLLKMSYGEISQVLPYEKGYQLLKKDGEIHWPARPIEWAWADIKKDLTNKKMQKFYNKLMKTLRVRVHKEVLISSLATPPAISTSTIPSH